MMADKDEAQLTASSSGAESDWVTNRRLTNQVTSQLRRDKLHWQQEKLQSCEDCSDTGGMWKNILGWLNWTSTGSPTKLLSQGSMETSPSRMAEIQNKYYIDKVRTIRES